MTADLELWLRGLWRHPNPCQHARVIQAADMLSLDYIYRCSDCGAIAHVAQIERVFSQRPKLVWT